MEIVLVHCSRVPADWRNEAPALSRPRSTDMSGVFLQSEIKWTLRFTGNVLMFPRPLSQVGSLHWPLALALASTFNQRQWYLWLLPGSTVMQNLIQVGSFVTVITTLELWDVALKNVCYWPFNTLFAAASIFLPLCPTMQRATTVVWLERRKDKLFSVAFSVRSIPSRGRQ